MLSMLILAAILTLTARAKDDDNHFTNPSSWTGINPEWELGDTQVIAWKTTLDTFNIFFWQQSIFQETAASQGNVYSKIHASDKVTNFTWTVQLYGFDLDYSNVFFFWINSDTPEGFTSAYFNITKLDPTSSTSDETANSTSSSASPITTSALNTTSSSSSPADTASPSSQPQTTAAEDSGLATTDKIALGVGLGVGLPILAGLAVLIWQRSRSHSPAPSASFKGAIDNANISDSGSGFGPAELFGGPAQSKPKSSTSAREVPVTGTDVDPSLVYPELPDRPNS